MTPLIANEPAASEPAASVRVTANEPVSGSSGRPPLVLGLTGLAVVALVLGDARVPGFAGKQTGADILVVVSGFAASWGLTRGRGAAAHLGITVLKLISRGPSLVLAAAVALLVSWLSSASAANAGLGGLADLATGSARNVPALLSRGEPSVAPLWLLVVLPELVVAGGLVLALAARAPGRLRVPAMATIICVAGFASWFSWAKQTSEGHIVSATYLPQNRVWEFAVGALAGLAVLAFGELGPAALRLWAGVGIMAALGSVWLQLPLAGHTFLRQVLPVVGTALALTCAGAGGTSGRWFLSNRFFRGLGTLGFGWYLWHGPFLQLAARIDGPNPSWGINLEMELLALWAACVSYLLLQRPLDRSWLRERPLRADGALRPA